MGRLNIMNKEGFLSNEDRKEPFNHRCNFISFKTNLDLSIPIKMTCLRKELSIDLYSQDLSSFMVWWTKVVMKDLNGFSGFSHVKFELVDFKIK